MKKIFRPGAVGALMDEYERAVGEYAAIVENIGEEKFRAVADAETADEDCRSIQTVTRHVVMAGHGYANYLREKFSLDESPVPRDDVRHDGARDKLREMLDYTAQTLEGRWEMTDGEITATVIHARWGATYDLEQLLEHAIVHVLRHRRQVEKFLLKLEDYG